LIKDTLLIVTGLVGHITYNGFKSRIEYLYFLYKNGLVRKIRQLLFENFIHFRNWFTFLYSTNALKVHSFSLKSKGCRNNLWFLTLWLIYSIEMPILLDICLDG